MSIVYIGLGSNLGNAAAQIAATYQALDKMPDSWLFGHSSLYRSPAMGAAYQGQPDYINAVAKLATRLSPHELLAELLHIEQEAGRSMHNRVAARTLDLDLLLYADQILDLPNLTVPHPRLHQRAFVLTPLLEVAPELTIPTRGRAQDWYWLCMNQAIQKIESNKITT